MDTISRGGANYQIVDYKFFEDGTIAFVFKLPTVAVFYKLWKKTENGFYYKTEQIGSESQIKLTKNDDPLYRIVGMNKVERVWISHEVERIEIIDVKIEENFVTKTKEVK